MTRSKTPTAATRTQPEDIERDLLFEEYRLGVQYLTNHLSRMWTRFNFFITLQTALAVALVGLYKDDRLTIGALAIPAIALLMSGCWYFIGAEDKYLVEIYRKQIGHTVGRLVPGRRETWPYIGRRIAELTQEVGQVKREPYQFRWEPLSITKLAALFPAFVGLLWLLVGLTLLALITVR